MLNNILPLSEISIAEVFNERKATYEVPIYQRNYAWEKDEIKALIQDVYDAFLANSQNSNNNQIYYIGTLVTYNKGDLVFEVIDGQQRLTTIFVILKVLGFSFQNKLTYRARKKSNDTISHIPSFEVEDKDIGIINGFKYASSSIEEIVPKESFKEFIAYFLHNVHIIHYQVPKDIDLNHYFEIMNSRGEQLEKHEIIKARLLEKLDDKDKSKFNHLWEYCSGMNVYIQQQYISDGETAKRIFGNDFCSFNICDFDSLPDVATDSKRPSINKLLYNNESSTFIPDDDRADSFQPIMDYSNFLLIILKLTRLNDKDFNPIDFTLDDKELIQEFDKVNLDNKFVKTFGFNLLRGKYLLDNYIVHHSIEDDTIDNNPWKLQCWQKEDNKHGYLKNLCEDNDVQNKMVQLLSMFEVSFTARQRKNYLFYCLLYLYNCSNLNNLDNYYYFLSNLADKFFADVYLVKENLNEINTPKPGSFDGVILSNNKLDIDVHNKNFDFTGVYGDGIKKSKGIPLFVFNYLDYTLWEEYTTKLKSTRQGSNERTVFFKSLGCSDFGLKVFDQFYFSRTRRSLEHYYPQANIDILSDSLNEDQINCLGNYAMIGSEANSSGSNWSPKTKLDHYLDSSGKIRQVSVASLKFMIMMQKCKDNQYYRDAGLEWNYDDITNHQQTMVELLKNRIINN